MCIRDKWEGIYENQQTSLYFSQNWGAGWSSFPAGAMNQYPIDPENAVALCWPPAVISWDLYHLDVFVAGQDGSLWHLPGAGAPLSDGNNAVSYTHLSSVSAPHPKSSQSIYVGAGLCAIRWIRHHITQILRRIHGYDPCD